MSTLFEPVAIVGQACVLPQANSPEELWKAVSEGRDLTTVAPFGMGRHVTTRIASPRGGFVTGFREVFDPRGFHLPPEDVVALDPLFSWILHTGREALSSARIPNSSGLRIGAVLGQMALPSAGARRFATSVWLGRRRGPTSEAEARDRFTSGLPALLLARALGLESGAFTVAAAGASSLYALKLACDRLHDRRADVMLAGAVSAADRTFCRDVLAALGVLSPSGRGRPLSREGDGLVPAEGAAFVALKRLDDALSDGDEVLAVIRGLAVAGDGRVSSESKGSQEAYEKVMRRTYEAAATAPEEVSLVECDAAGVVAADGVEIRALARVFQDAGDLPLGSVKSNLGHAFAASGLVGLLKVIGALRAKERPPTLHAESPHSELSGTPLRLLHAPEAWPGTAPRKAAVSAFGLGGHTAHLLVEELVPERVPAPTPPRPSIPLQPEVAVVSVATAAADAWDADDFVRLLMSGESHLGEDGGRAESFLLSREDLRLAPRDLKPSLPQQLALLAVARQALAGVEPPPREATGIYAGIQADVEMARFGLRRHERRHAAPRLTDRAVAGALPEVAVQRLARQLYATGPSFAVAAEELSGIVALELAVRALERGEIDVAVVGAVDLCCEPVHTAAAGALLGLDRTPPGDAACVLVLKRRAAARRAGERILALIERVETAPREPWVEPSPADPDRSALLVLGLGGERLGLTPRVGHAHAASGLLHVAAGVLACHHRAFPAHASEMGFLHRGRGRSDDARSFAAVPWLVPGRRRAEVRMEALGGGRGAVEIREERTGRAGPLLVEEGFPRLHLYSGADREAVARRVAAQSPPDPPGRGGGPARLVLVAGTEEELHRLGRQAQKLIEISGPGQTLPAMEGVYFRDEPLAGKLAFVFTGGMASYSGMGRELLLALPELAVELGRRSRVLGAMASWIYDSGQSVRQLGPQELVLGGTFLSLVYAELTRTLLGIVPDAAMGYSLGEVDALLALGAWRDLDELYQDSVESGLFTYSLGGRMAAVRRLWKSLPPAGQATRSVGDPGWAEWVLHAPPAKVEAALANERQVFLTRIHSRDEVAVGGDPSACRRVIEKVGARGYLLGAPLALHCPAVRQVEEAWLALHRRKVHDTGGLRFYTHAGGGYAYEPTSDAAAEALLEEAAGTVDVPRLVGRAWDDGVRIFVEHAPQGLATGWIRKALSVLGIPSDAYLAVALDSETGGLRHTAHSLARLLASGVDLDYGAFNERPPGHLAAGAPSQGRATSREILAFPAHWPPVPKPESAEPRAPLPVEAPPKEEPARAPAPLPPPSESLAPTVELGTAMAEVQALFSRAQQEFVTSQNEVHRRFLEVAGRNFGGVLRTLPATGEENTP